MKSIEILTLVDITNTKVIRINQGSQLELDQQRNFITLGQCIALRSIIDNEQPPVVEIVDIKGMGFGNKFKGKHQIWTYKFTPDRADAYLDSSGNILGLLIEDIDSVPVIKNLTETINMDKAIFNLKDPSFKNTIIRLNLGSI